MIPIFGLSVFLHLAIIVSAKALNYFRGNGKRSAYQSYNKNGGLVQSKFTNKLISYAILVFVSCYMIRLAFIAIITAISVGADEPQVIAYREFAVVLWMALSYLMLQTVFVYIIVGLVVLLVSVRYAPPVAVMWARYTTFLQILLANFSFKRILNVAKEYTPKTMPTLQLNFRGLRKPALEAVSTVTSQKVSRFQNTVAIPMLAGMVVAACLFLLPLFARAQIVEPGFESEVVVDGLSLATTLDFTPDGRILIAEKGGSILIIKNGVLLPEPLITLTDVNNFGDRGLLGLAVDPNFINNGYVYVLYTYENTPGVNVAGPKTGRIVRLTVEGDIASESSKFVLVGSVGGSIETPSCEDLLVTDDCIASDSNSHSVGGLRFGPDGKLYATLGDGADFVNVDPRALRAQNIDALAGKLLRINTDGTAPTDNPFYNGNSNANRSKVYALGLRNAFRFNFHPITGKLYLGDVGWGNWEEINLVVPGGNYGWPCREGDFATTYGCQPTSPAINPLYVYPHNAAGAGSITAGSFPSNGAYPSSYNNSLFIADYSQMWMKRLELNPTGTAVIGVDDFNTDLFPVEIITGPDGNVYYIDIVFGTLNRLTHTDGNRRPVVSLDANTISGLIPLNVTFSSQGTYDPDGNVLTYAWSFGDGTTSSVPNPSHLYSTNGTYTASLEVTDSFGSAVAKSITIYVGNQAPQAQIINPASGSLYNVGGTISVNGEGTDPENGVLPPSAFSWEVILHHNVHTHTIYQVTGSSSITFPADDHNDSDVYLEIVLTVVDSAGLEHSKSINMYVNNGIGSGNLISNPSIEIEATSMTSPLNWYQNWYGVMNPVFTYPVVGYAGTKAAQITVSNYQSGSAKWLSSPAFVTPGESYTFSDLYTATTPTDILVQFVRTNGTYEYLFLSVVPPVSEPTRNTFTFTVPAGIETATVFHELANNGTLVIDDFSLTLTNGGDVTPPAGAINTLVPGSTLYGIVQVGVTASDNIGVASVQLFVNANPVGVNDSEAPYTLQWDTAALTDGNYIVTARISDTSGNTADTPSVNVSVDNGNNNIPNLIQNGDFETVNGLNPLGWQPGGWGTLTSQFSYPVAGVGGGSAIEVQITNYEYGDTGDARWVHTSVPVTSGTEYTYRTMYKSNSISDIIGRYTFADGSDHHFGLIKEIQPASTWTQLEKTFVPPVGAETVTFFHLISSEATLTIDNVELFATGTGTPSEINPPSVNFVYPNAGAVLSGTVTLVATSSDDTAVVGVYFAINGTLHGIEDATAPYEVVWDTTLYPDGDYVIKATTHDPYGNNDKVERLVTVNNASTTTPPAASNLVLNSALETLGTTGNPANWNRGGWGTNTRTYTYPATGVTGNGASVTISGYVSGDAKWFFNDVAVTPGTQYTISNRYNSTIGSEALIRYTLTGGATQYLFLSALPATGGTWATLNRTFTPPANTVSMTLFHLIAANGTLTIDDMSVTGPAGTSTDTTAPVVTIASPASGTTVSGSVAITASSSDASGVASVSLLIDGTIVGSSDTTAPYTFVWNSASSSNGSHTISARAIDTRGNVATATPVSIIVNNTTTPPPPPPVATSTNLVLNSTLETVGTAGNPANYNRGGWGTNNRTFTYPVAGASGNGAEVAITTYTGGDAKWYFDPVMVNPGEQYTFSYAYKSSVATNITLKYTRTDGTPLYVGVAAPVASAAWTTDTFSFVPPAGVTDVSVMHILTGIGSLAIDNQQLSSGNTNSFNRGKVSFSFDDGWVEHATVAQPTLDGLGIDGTFYIITDSSLNDSIELVPNSNLETTGTVGNPANFNRGGWGTNDRIFTYPATSTTGNAAEVTITTYTSGDAKWYFNPIDVTPTLKYTVSDMYRSTATTEIVVQYTKTDGTFQYEFLQSLPTTGGARQTFNREITIPSGIAKLTVFHILASVGSLAIDSVSVKPARVYVNKDQILSLQANGHEIGGHTRTHPDLTTLSTAEKTNEINGSRQALLTNGVNSVTSMAYPYGSFDISIQTIAANSGYTSARSVLRGYNDKTTNRYALVIQQISRDDTVAEIQSWIDQAAASNTWLILMFHQISNATNDTLGITPTNFTSVANYAKTANVDIVTVSQGAALLQ